MGMLTSSWAHAHGSFDPGQYASLALTHVQYHPQDPLAYPLSLITLSPPFLIVVYIAICLIRRDLTIILGFLGQLGCEGLNLILKRIFKQGRPTNFLGTGYGMPSSHSQFVGYFMTFWCAHFIRFRPGKERRKRTKNRKPSLIDLIRNLEHAILVLFIIFGSLMTAYSRYHLSYHTPLQIFVGLSLGMGTGLAWYLVCEVIGRKVIFGFKRSPRRILLENPLFVALRIRDTWSVWDDGGIEAEYGLWRMQWDKLQKEQDSPVAKETALGRTYEHDVETMISALRLARKCDQTSTAFCVGCVIANDETGEILATGYSREQPGNTHAEEVAINKIRTNSKIQANKVRVLPLSLYTTMEPCSERLSKKDACVQNILKFNQDALSWSIGGETVTLRIVRIVQGVREPEDFVQCIGTRMLGENGLMVETFQAPTLMRKGKESVHLRQGWYEREAIRLAKYGHDDQPTLQSEEEEKVWKEFDWTIDDPIPSPESRKSR